jgi:hypothetical protein
MKKIIAILAALSIVIFVTIARADTLAPLPMVKAQFFNVTGTLPCASCVVYFCEAGSTCPGTPKDTYTDYTGGVANTNPVGLDSAGRAYIWLKGFYKVVVKTAVGGTTISTGDYVSAAPQQSTLTVSEWQVIDVVPTYLSATSFSVPGDYITTFTAGRRIKSINTGGTLYSTIVSSSYASSVTTVTVANDSTSLDSGITTVSVGILTMTNPSIPIPQTLSKTANYTITAMDNGKTIISENTGIAVTISIATPAVLTTSTTHGFTVNQIIGLVTTATLPNPLTASTPYYIIVDGLTANNFEIAASAGGAAIITSGVQSGTHTVQKYISFALPVASGVPNGFYTNIKNNNPMPLTISGTVDGSTTLKLLQYDEMRLSSNGSTWSGNRQNFRPGMVLGLTSVYSGAVATGIATVPYDDSIPQITEGDQFLEVSYTPKSSTSKLIVESVGHFSTSGVSQTAMSLYRDSEVNAIATTWQYTSTDTELAYHLNTEVTSGNTSPKRFSMRFGGDSASTTTFNGANATRKYGGNLTSFIRVTEIAQ